MKITVLWDMTPCKLTEVIQMKTGTFVSNSWKSALFWDTMRRRVLIVYRRFGTSWPFKMGPIRCPETSVNNYHTTPRNIPEERRSYQHRGGSLKSEFAKGTLICFGVTLSQRFEENAVICCLLACVCGMTTPDLIQPVTPWSTSGI